MVGHVVILVFLLINAAFSLKITDDLVLTLPDGKIQGAAYITATNKTYYGFRGIPYAAPPIDDLRFEPPQSPEPWNNIRNATTDGTNCISSLYFDRMSLESEDCLYLNVYIPTLEPTVKLPVMFYVPGGGFMTGSADKNLYGPDFLIEEDIILVTTNYRLGPFGFLSTGDSALPGNLGLKDQNFALKWTYTNIEYFGGEANNITIFGESAGGVSVGLHLVSKQSAGLFTAAIVESGSALTPWSLGHDPRTVAFSLAMGIPGGSYDNDTQLLKDFLKERKVAEIVSATSLLKVNGIIFPPVIEQESDHAFLTESPYELLARGDYNQVPAIFGICAEESLMFLHDLNSAQSMALDYDTDTSMLIPDDLYSNDTVETEVVQKIHDLYLTEHDTFSENLVAFADYITDDWFARGVIKQAELAATRNPVYVYQFAYSGRPSTAPFINGAEKASHAAENSFLFNIVGVSNTTASQDLLIQKQMSTLWTNFAKYWNPTPNESDLFGNVTWPVFNSGDLPYININNTVEIRTNIKGNTYSKWNDIFETYGRKPFITF